MPAASAARAIGAWVRAGVAMATASMSSRRSKLSSEVSTSTVDRGADDLAGAALVEIADRDQIPVRRATEVADQVRTPIAGADDGYPKF